MPPLYQLLMQIKPLLEEDADYIAAFDEHFRQVTVGNHQDMPLKIEIQNWDRDGADWVEVPFDYDTKNAVVPRTRHRQRITVDGTVIVERTMLRFQEFMGIPDFVDDTPDGMVYVNRTGPRNRVTFVEIEPFYCDQYEVSNAEFKEFVDAGGYGEPVFWKTAFQEISEEESDNLRDSFVDSTGKLGPGHWVHGSFPEGLGNHPVHSVSWYEAMAYAEFRGKALPTSFHWRWATHAADELVVPHSNFDGEGAKPRGANEGIGYRPIFDAAGNVNEWTLNGFEDSQNKCCCGASWDDPHYLFRARQAMSPSTRSDKIGFRCIRVIESYDERLNSPVSPRVFNIVEEGMSIRKDITVIMVAPKSPGSEVREEYKRGFGVPTLIAVHPENDPNGDGLDQAKAYAFATGGHRAGVLESSFVAEVKSDLMGEQTILCGVLQTGSILSFNKMVDDKKKFKIHLSKENDSQATELIVIAPDHHGLFSRISGLVAASGYDVVSAKIITRSD